jgi:hypothetical protein
MTQVELILSYFQSHPQKDIPHAEVVDWVVTEWKAQTGEVFRDPDRGIRSLAQRGDLIKVAKGVYRYAPNLVQKRDLEDFSATDKAAILKRDGYRCVICGKGVKEGVELQVDHIKPKDLSGKATLDNGQTLCAQHNFQKKNYKQTETGKRMFIRLLSAAREIEDANTIAFCEAILKTYEAFNINGHIEWEK